MPFKSEKQRGFMFANMPDVARAWSREKRVRKNAPKVSPKRAALDILAGGKDA
jgi:hypothetical protein